MRGYRAAIGSGSVSGEERLPLPTAALVFASVWTSWISVGRQSGALFVAFSAVAWLGFGWSLLQALFAMFGRTTLQLGATRYLIRQRLFGYERRYEGPIEHLEGAGIHRNNTRNGTSEQCVLHTGVKSVKFGAHLSVVERSWLVDLINEQLGIGTEAGELDEED